MTESYTPWNVTKAFKIKAPSKRIAGKGVWKMPTGLLIAREDIGAAAEREVLEVWP